MEPHPEIYAANLKKGRCSNYVFYKSRIPGARRSTAPCGPHLRPRRRCPQNPCACASAHEDQTDGQMLHIRLHLGLPLSGVYRIETKKRRGQRPLRPLSVLYAGAPSGRSIGTHTLHLSAVVCLYTSFTVPHVCHRDSGFKSRLPLHGCCGSAQGS